MTDCEEVVGDSRCDSCALQLLISLAVEEKKGKVSLLKEVTIEQKLDKIMKQNESILKELKKIEEDLTFMKKELHIIRRKA